MDVEEEEECEPEADPAAKISISMQPKPIADQQKEESGDTAVKNDDSGSSHSDQPEFNSPKEKQCWELFCKMSGKGVNVSFDTILRGMLTPTEYRMRKKPSLEEETAVEVATC